MNGLYRTTMILLATAVFAMPVDARITRIMSDNQREQYLTYLEAVINFEDAELEEAIPYIVNPFFFDQPMLLKLQTPGGISDEDVLVSFAGVIIKEISGAFVRGTKRSLLMKSGELMKEGDQLSRKLPDLGNIEAKVTIGDIQRSGFVLKLNNSEFVVDLSDQ